MKTILIAIVIIFLFFPGCQNQSSAPSAAGTGKSESDDKKGAAEKQTVTLLEVPYPFKASVKRLIVHGGSRETNFSFISFNDPKGEDGGQLTENGVVETEALSLLCGIKNPPVRIPLPTPCTIDSTMILRTKDCGDLHIVSASNKYKLLASDGTVQCIKNFVNVNEEGKASDKK